MNLDEIIQAINQIRRNKACLSNAFFTKIQIEEMLRSGNLQAFRDKGLLLLLKEEVDLIRAYFYAEDDKALGKINVYMPKCDKPIVADIVGRKDKAKTLAGILTKSGFEQYRIFMRMSCSAPQIHSNVDISRVGYATSCDINRIYELLYSEFDPLFSHIPSRSEIASAIEKKEITVVWDGQKIAGFSYFEVVSTKNIVLRFFMVDSKYRGQGIGNTLLAYTFYRHTQGIIYYLWVGVYNQAIKLYMQRNFRQDTMTDYILIFKGE